MTDIQAAKIMEIAINHYGEDAQKVVAIEEMSELQKELTKSIRGAENKHEVAEEIADVRIMLMQMEMIFSCDEEVRCIMCDKLERLMARIAEDLTDTKEV